VGCWREEKDQGGDFKDDQHQRPVRWFYRAIEREKGGGGGGAARGK